MAENITATEILRRKGAANPTALLAPMIRQASRRLLRYAIEGTSDDKLRYALDRAISPLVTEYALYGRVEHDVDATAARVVIIFGHLEHAAQRRAA